MRLPSLSCDAAYLPARRGEVQPTCSGSQRQPAQKPLETVPSPANGQSRVAAVRCSLTSKHRHKSATVAPWPKTIEAKAAASLNYRRDGQVKDRPSPLQAERKRELLKEA